MKSRNDYEQMDREELVAIIGGDIDPTTPHSELVAMAMERDSDNM